MRILIVTPASRTSLQGNRVTADRWGMILSDLGHTVHISKEYEDEPCDLLIALHARKSAKSVDRFRRRCPHSPLLLALTGTDLYQDLADSDEARRSLDQANFLITLHPLAARELTERHRERVRVIYQSVVIPPGPLPTPPSDTHLVGVVGHLRSVKDPLRAAYAARLLPKNSKIQIHHLGAATDSEWEGKARLETRENPRYHWLGPKPRDQTLSWIAGCHVLCLTSLVEGGANVLGEAIRMEVPVVCSAISGSLGLLGEDYPGVFPVQDTEALAALLLRTECDPVFLRELKTHVQARTVLFAREREIRSWSELLDETRHLPEES